MVKTDLHNHLRTRSVIKPGDFNKSVNTATRRLGPAGIFGMVNFSDKRYEGFIDSAGYERTPVSELEEAFYLPEQDVYIIKGQEIPTKNGHLLIMGLPKHVHLQEQRTLEDTIKEAQDNNGIILADHPFYIEGAGEYLRQNKHLLEQIDGIETHNGEAAFGLPIGPIPLGANKKAQEFYKEVQQQFPHLGAISTSDGHSLYELGTSWTETDFDTKKPGFTKNLRKAIHKTNLQTPRQNTNSYLGAIDHITDLVTLIATNKIPGITIR